MSYEEELIGKIKACEELKERGYVKNRCSLCNGTGHKGGGKSRSFCFKCEGRGYNWEIERALER